MLTLSDHPTKEALGHEHSKSIGNANGDLDPADIGWQLSRGCRRPVVPARPGPSEDACWPLASDMHGVADRTACGPRGGRVQSLAGTRHRCRRRMPRSMSSRPALSTRTPSTPTAGALWMPQDELVDGKAVKFLSGSGGAVVYLTRTVRCQTAGEADRRASAAGEQLEVWLNGRKIASAATRLTLRPLRVRRGVDGTRVDQVLIDLESAGGRNLLLVRLHARRRTLVLLLGGSVASARLLGAVRRDFRRTRARCWSWSTPTGSLRTAGSRRPAASWKSS
jgi:hypothetical protein